jgi:TonB family protein
MADTRTTDRPEVPARPEADEPRDVLFLFDRPAAGTGPTGLRAWWERAGFSLVVHGVAVVLLGLFLRYAPAGSMLSSPMQSFPFEKIIFLPQPGPGGGGGGGGNRMPDPPRRAQDVGKDKITVPVEKPQPVPVPQAAPKELPPPGLTIPAVATADSNFTIPGALDNGSAFSQGPGSGGGSGTGTGTGIGPGNGSGLGPGWGGGFGGGAYHPGSGIEIPVLLKEVRPQYTADAMRAKVQGVVIVECVVLPDGTVGDVRVQKSLDPVFGLDQEAIKAAKQWRFVPGKRQGQPVPVLISIELTFTLR